ncbi:MAG: hypothetical protein JOY54_00330 [Acidobacteriaceae bacterium]|nr:hypothetical protein [Acidobacteriaceae bacterium]
MPNPFWIGPNTAFVLAIFGVLGIYCEFIWPGRVFQGLLGAAALVTGGYVLYRQSPSTGSLGLIAASALLFLAETIWSTRFIAGVLATAALAAGACTMFSEPPRIGPGLAIPLSCVFGAITTALASIARRARRNKWSDIE